MFMCDYPELFDHNVEKEFMADDIFEVKARLKKKLQGAFANKLGKKMKGNMGAALAGKMAKPAGAPGSSGIEMQNRSRLPLTGGERLEDV
jgi:hypothetical protein